MSVWDYLFDTEHDHALDQERADTDEQALRDAVAAFGALKRDLAQAQHQIDRLQLVTEALVGLLELRTGIDRKELGLMIQRLDLADGVEDNRLGPDKSAAAPKCPHCGRPVNLRRSKCIYCFAAVGDGAATTEGRRAAETRRVRCSKCGGEVPETSVFFSDEGLLCKACAS